MQSRYYNPEWGRFINADGLVTTGQGLLSHNMFAYCANNPAKYADTNGYYHRDASELIGGGGGALLVATAMVISQAMPGVIDAADDLIQYIKARAKTKQNVQAIPHGNSKKSSNPQHGYEIYNIANGDVVKCGISGGKIRLDGKSYRAEMQVRAFNRDPFDGNTYASRIVAYLPDRKSALLWEEAHSQLLWDAGNSMSKHIRPRPWRKS